MKKTLLFIAVAIFATTGAIAYSNFGKKCTGTKSCTSCKNCKYCKNCSKDGGSCGVCKK